MTEGRAGPGIALWAAQHLLQPTDLVHVLHVLAKSDRGNGHGAAVGSSPSGAISGGQGSGSGGDIGGVCGRCGCCCRCHCH